MARQKIFSVSIHDCRVETFRCGGKGGQKVNKTSSGVRIRHIPSGAVGESREERSQHANKKKAFRRMVNTPEFQAWVKLECARRSGEIDEISRRVDEAMHPRNLMIECKENGKWELCKAPEQRTQQPKL